MPLLWLNSSASLHCNSSELALNSSDGNRTQKKVFFFSPLNDENDLKPKRVSKIERTRNVRMNSNIHSQCNEKLWYQAIIYNVTLSAKGFCNTENRIRDRENGIYTH